MTKWRIGIDARALQPPVTGTGVYLREILAELAVLAPQHDYLCYTTRAECRDSLPEGPFHLRLGRTISARWGTVWLQSGVLRSIRKDGIDLFWGPLQVVPLALVGRLPTVVTLHDLVFRHYPETMSLRNRLALPFFATRSLRGADAVVTTTRATADSAVRELGVARERIVVLPHGVSERFRPVERDLARRRLRQLGVDADEILLFVGTLEPRKNLDGLLRALDSLLVSGRFDGCVVLVGAPGWKTSRLLTDRGDSPLARRIHALGYVDEDDLPALYSAARLLVMPSHYEGFGLPVLEAMACGTPVLVSDRPPLPEVTGGAARHFRASDDRDLAAAIDELWHDERLRGRLAEAGRRRAAELSWRRSAEGHLELFGRLLDDVRRRRG